MADMKPSDAEAKKLGDVSDVKNDERSMVGRDELGGAGFLSKAERPYAGDLKGRIEDAQRDPVDARLQAEAAAQEQRILAENDAKFSQHANVGFAGNYSIGAEVER